MNRLTTSVAVAMLFVVAVAAAVYLYGDRTRDGFKLSGTELRDEDIKVSLFSRHMKITSWNWPNTAAATDPSQEERDTAIYSDMIFFNNPAKRPILWHDNTVVRGKVFIDFISAPWRLVSPPEYEEWSSYSKLEYETLISPPRNEAEPSWLIRQFRYVDTFPPANGQSQAGLRIPYSTDLVVLILDLTSLPKALIPAEVTCRVRLLDTRAATHVNTGCLGSTRTSSPAVFSVTLSALPALSQVVLEWSWPK
jgi:hypothetical protein